jgi:hypothetical protein
MKIKDERGYELVSYTGDHLKLPSKTHLTVEEIDVDEMLIGQTSTLAAKVFFVGGHNGDSYGQYPTLEEAIAKLKLVLSVPKAARLRFDE